METVKSLDKAIELVGLADLATALGGTYQMVTKWRKKGSMPNSDFSGKTRYSGTIEELTKGEVRVEDLLGFRPPFYDER